MEFTVKLTDDDLRAIAAALNELPYRMAAPTMDKLKAQVEEQRPKPPAPPPEAH